MRFRRCAPFAFALTGMAVLALVTAPVYGQQHLVRGRPVYCPPPPCPPAPCPTLIEKPPVKAAEPPRPAPKPEAEPARPEQAPQVPPEPSADERGLAMGGASVALADSGVGYIDPAIPATQMRLRFDAAYDNNRPDRAEFFYGKCGCFRLAGLDPNAPGPPAGPPPRVETGVDYQDIAAYLELAPAERFSAFIELPVRFLNPEIIENTAGLADMNAGIKYALLYDPGQVGTFQLRTYIPTGESERGLGTHHVSLEPAFLYYRKLSERLVFEGEFRDWIPIDGTDFAGNVIRYGTGLSFRALDTCKFSLSPVLEVVGWTVLGGRELAVFSPTAFAVKEAEGETIVNAKAGVRLGFGERDNGQGSRDDRHNLYVGYGRALTGDVWYKDVLRVEYRLGF